MVPAQIAAQSGVVTAMHDPTEGGVATGLWNWPLRPGGAGDRLGCDSVSPLAAKLCAAYDLDPLGTIASGALLATCAPDDAEKLCNCGGKRDGRRGDRRGIK